MRHLSGKVAVITGAASGIGRALAVRLAAQGVELALADIDADGLDRAARVAVGSPRVTVRTVDVADRAAVELFARAVDQRHGGVDILVNNAGVGCVATVEQVSYADIEWVLGVDLWGVIHGVKVFLPLLRRRAAASRSRVCIRVGCAPTSPAMPATPATRTPPASNAAR